jgi:hypothetical protein
VLSLYLSFLLRHITWLKTNHYMRKLVLALLAFAAALSTTAQTKANFENLQLNGPNTYYQNFTAPGTDVGFISGLVKFPCVYDTSFGYSFQSSGFVYSNVQDSVTAGFMNQYSTRAGKGYNGSGKYCVSYGGSNKLFLQGAAQGQPVAGFYISNSTYAYLSMQDGDAFAKKFGGVDGTDPDWFKVVVRGYLNGSLKTDSVEFFLSDFRFTDSDSDYIVKDWRWLDLMSLGKVDSLDFSMSSSDNGQFGMNTPAYFCIDNLETRESLVSVITVSLADVARVYPNPVSDRLYVELSGNHGTDLQVYDLTGKLLMTEKLTGARAAIRTESLVPGVYLLRLAGGDAGEMLRFVKQ